MTDMKRQVKVILAGGTLGAGKDK